MSIPTATVTTGTIRTTNASGNVVIGDTATTTDILNLDVASGGPTIDVGTGAGVVFMYANVTGSQGFTKTGAGTLTFRFNPHNMAYTGTVTLNQGTLGLNQDGSLGDTSNPLSVTGNSTLLIAPGSNSGTVAFAAGRTMTIASSVTSTVQNNNAAQTVVFNNPIGGSGALALNTGTFTLNGNNTYAGATTLTNVNRLTLGNGSRISSAGLTVTTPVAATFGTVIDLGGNAQSVSSLAFTTGTSRVTSTITNGSLNVTGGNLTLNSGTTAAATGTQTYDLSGLSAFTYNNAAGTFAATVSATTASLTGQTRVNLANAGNSGTNTITALNVNIGNSSSNNATNSTVIGLGKFNTFNSGTMQVGFFQGSGTMGFQSGVSNGVLTLRGTAGGSSSMDTLTVGYNNSGNRTGQGTLNLAGGTLDARVNTLNVGFSLQSIANSSSLVMGSGTVVAGLLNLGGGNNLSTATFTQSQGDVTAGSLLFGGTASAGTPHYSLTYNLNGGSLRSGTIATNLGTFSSTTSRTIAWTAGTIANYDASTDLTINGTTGAGGALTLSLGGAGTKTLAADLGRTITFGANALISSTGALTVNGAGTVVINGSNSYSGDTSLSAGTLRTGNANALGTGAITVASGATLDLNSLAVPNTITNNGGTVTNAASYAGSQSLSGSSSFGALGGTVTVNSGGIANFAGAMTGGVTVNTGGVANVAAGGSVAGILTLAGGGLTGVGTVGVISGTGLVGPGNSPGIMTSTGSLDPTGGADFAFEFTGAVPTWSTGTASVNDVLRLTAAAPITSALTSGNVINVYLNAGSLTAGNTFLGGLFIDQTQGSVDLAPLVANATFAYFVAGGTDATYNTIGYSTLANYMAANPGITGITPSTVTVASADFSGNTITNGQTLQFAIVPEPGAMTLVACGAAVAAWAAARRHRRR